MRPARRRRPRSIARPPCPWRSRAARQPCRGSAGSWRGGPPGTGRRPQPAPAAASARVRP
eukprot:12254853-Alexandrium_andersonii.AAC.1